MKKRILSIMLTLCMVFCLVPISVFAEGETGVALDGINFPDATFRTYIAERFDTDRDGNLSDAEIAAVTKIECYERGIGDLTGIEHFTALTYLDCDSNPIKKLDVSRYTALEHLLCSGTGLTVLDVSHNTALKELRCNRNQLTALDVTHNKALEELQCNNNQLTTLDVSQNTALKKLQFGGNKLTSWDITNNKALEELACDDAGLTALDVSHNTALKALWCNDNQLTALDVSKNINLKRLYCYNNLLTVLDVSHNAALETLMCSGNRLTSMDLSRNTELRSYEGFNNAYQIVLDENRTFDLSALPGSFDVSKARNWKGGTVSGTTLTVPNDRDTITYDYICGKYERTFTLTCSKASYTVTFLGSWAAAQTVFHGEKATKPANPIKPGYRFLGWYEGYSLYNFDTPVTKNITLNDGWELCDHSGSTKLPDCTTSVTCTECSGTIAALGHDFSASLWQHDKDTHWKKCSRCEVKNDENPHDWNSGKVTVKPTCMTAGEKVFTCDKCDATKIESIQANGHNWNQDWQHNKTHHWHECFNADCDVKNNDSAKDGYGAHTGGTATCTEKAKCEVCNENYGSLDVNNHTGIAEWTKDAQGHEKKWSCCGAVIVASEAHEWTDGICQECGYGCLHTDADKNHICDICGKIISNHEDANKDHVCDFCEKIISNHEDANKDHICDYCNKIISNHVDTDKNHVCDFCEKVISNHEDSDKNHICDYCGKIISNHEDTDNNHICDYCGKIITNHTGGKATCKDRAVCEVCGKAYGELDANNHSNLKHIEAKAATKDAEGNIEYWYCEGCGKYYSDAAATKEIKKTDTVTAKLPDDSKSPQTGDNGNLMLWFTLLFISGGVCTALTVKRKKLYRHGGNAK